MVDSSRSNKDRDLAAGNLAFDRLDFETKRFPLRLSPQSKIVVNTIQGLNAELEQHFPTGYIGTLWRGSRTLGYGTTKSDLDYDLVVSNKALNADLSRRSKADDNAYRFGVEMIKMFISDGLSEFGIKANCISAHNSEKYARALNADQSHLWLVAGVFGLSSGSKIRELRRDLVDEIASRPDRDAVWKIVQDQFRERFLQPWKELEGRRERQLNAAKRLFPERDPSEVLATRLDRVGLPSLEAMQKILQG